MNDNIVLKIFLVFLFGFIIFYMLQYNIEPWGWPKIRTPKFVSSAINKATKVVKKIEKKAVKEVTSVTDKIEDTVKLIWDKVIGTIATSHLFKEIFKKDTMKEKNLRHKKKPPPHSNLKLKGLKNTISIVWLNNLII